MKLSFYGGAGEVTGANYLLECEGKKIIIDCGLFQGDKFAQEKNFEEFPYNPREIDAVFLTHAHIDHCGRLPFLYKQGCRGPIYATPPTKDLTLLSLRDSQNILREEAEEHNREILYTKEDVETVQLYFQQAGYGDEIKRGPFSIQFFNAGHILGSSIIEVIAGGKTILFSGDLGNSASPFLDPPSVRGKADYVVMESVYGDRVHKKDRNRNDDLEDIIEDNAKRGGALMIPAFALERVQELLYDINSLIGEGRVPSMPVFVDSPLAIDATAIFQSHPLYYQLQIREEMRKNKNFFSCQNLSFTRSVDESKHINDVPPPKIIIAGSGMSQGGRILHHELRYLPHPSNTILFIGYQTKNSRGRAILEGAKTVSIFGEKVSVRSHIASISGYSAHADQEELVNWVRPFKDVVSKVFLVQGDREAAEALSYQLKDFLGTDVVIPSYGESVELL